MLYVDDWEKIKQRHLAWWEGEIVDRMAIRVGAPRDDVAPYKIPDDVDLDRFWTDPEYVVEVQEAQFATSYFACDSFPFHLPFLGPIVQAAFLGCKLEFRDTRTGWLKPMIESWDAAPELAYDAENRWWRLMQELTRTAVKAGRDRFMVGLTDLCSPGDDVAALRGSEEALLDFMDDPDLVDETMRTMTDLWKRYIDELYQILLDAGQVGSGGTFSIYSPGKSYTMQSDFSCMVSPTMFDRHIAPILEVQAKHLDHAIYHVDGPEAVRHVPSVCAIPEINALNWIPGAGNGPMRRWAELLKDIQDRGKPVQCSVTVEDIEPILEVASPRGLLLDVRCESQAEADEIVKKAEGWTARYDKPFGIKAC